MSDNELNSSDSNSIKNDHTSISSQEEPKKQSLIGTEATSRRSKRRAVDILNVIIVIMLWSGGSGDKNIESLES